MRTALNLGMAASVLALGFLAANGVRAQETAYPRAIERQALLDWLGRETDITPDQVLAVSPMSLTAVVSTYPLFAPPGLRVSVRAEALTPQASARGAISWQTTMNLDCRGRRIMAGATTGYASRNLLGQPIPISSGDNDWREPPAGTQLEAVWRAFCERDFKRPLAGEQLVPVQDQVATPAPQPAPPTPRPTLGLTPARPIANEGMAGRSTPAPAPRPQPAPVPARRVVANVAVQVIGSASESEARKTAEQTARRMPVAGAQLTPRVTQAVVDGRTVYRGLVSGFASRAEAVAWCGRLKAAGGACFLR